MKKIQFWNISIIGLIFFIPQLHSLSITLLPENLSLATTLVLGAPNKITGSTSGTITTDSLGFVNISVSFERTSGSWSSSELLVMSVENYTSDLPLWDGYGDAYLYPLVLGAPPWAQEFNATYTFSSFDIVKSGTLGGTITYTVSEQ